VKISAVVDPKNLYFPVTQEQDEFEGFLFSAVFPFPQERDEVLEQFTAHPRRELTEKILTFSQKMNHFF
jgi:hypothetical protein